MSRIVESWKTGSNGLTTERECLDSIHNVLDLQDSLFYAYNERLLINIYKRIFVFKGTLNRV